ncbi:sulfatase-like hydrolase/transferase [Lactobacillus sp. S2-2]|uniref:LTA synthase family protein n=1 Tax=Lactobacillus sp. S2-2 TaxID=2692917 RepID=UPI001F458921|nr:LTA synthase family protein [Lactobacillus sp. S2-2]MCF6515263.1 sulfatase-like hydrolase/transferase [Lactobacillus sp. S2-2]
MNKLKRLFSHVNTRVGFIVLLTILIWLKTLLAYFTDFNLGIDNAFQFILMIINPIASTIILSSVAFLFKPAKLFYPIALLMDLLNTVILYLNVIYFREFTDFMTVSTITGYSKVNQGLSGSSLALTKPHDVFYWIDLIVIIGLILFKVIKLDKRIQKARIGFAIFSLGSVLLLTNIALADMDRPQLLTRTFDRSYIVKYLGLNSFTVYDGIKSQQNKEMRATATKSAIDDILKHNESHYAEPSKKTEGIAKNKNVIILHLESLQQFVINKKINGKEVTPFLNSLYKNKSTYSFDNFFHQVGQGKTSDAENLLETSTYGLPQGSLFTQVGSDNEFEAAPAILGQDGYTSAVFHGNNASFWNRDNTYKNLGYQYFFDASYYNTSGDRATGYGLKDKLLFHDSVKYLEKLQQPFYAKFITVTNHFPFDLDSEDTKDSTFKTTGTNDSKVNNYFVTAHYLDKAVKEFYQYLYKSGLAKNSMIVLYGDHYGLSNSENTNLASVLGKDPNSWNGFDNAQLQRVPFMINLPGTNKGYEDHTYGGEIDVLPTILHMLGINTKKYVQFGTDLFSKQHDSVVAFRNRDWVSPKYSSIGGVYYDSKTGQPFDPDDKLREKLHKVQDKVNTELSYSDSLNQKNLLRFYDPKGFKKVNPKKYNYDDGIAQLNKIQQALGNKSTSLYSKNKDKSTQKLYKTDAPELTHDSGQTNRISNNNLESSSSQK